MEVTEGWKILHNEESHNLFLSQNAIRIIKSRKTRLGEGGSSGTYRREEKVLGGCGEKTCRKETAWRTWTQMEEKIDLKEMGLGNVD